MTASSQIPPAIQIEDDRTGVTIPTLRRALADNLYYVLGKPPDGATLNDYYLALAYTVRDRLMQRWMASTHTHRLPTIKQVIYLSAEYLPGPHLGNNLMNLGLYETVQQAVAESGLDLATLLACEEEPGLGNGGLGRLAACFMDSLATLEIPAIGYGIRYEFGIFDQEIREGWQAEITDKWLQSGNPWEIARPEDAVFVKLGGHTEASTDETGCYQVRWIPHQTVKGIPYDTPIPGYRVNTVNTLRLWKAEAPESFDLSVFNHGDYYGAVDQKVISENLTKVLYPNDEPIQGKQLRLKQQYFFVSCALQDLIRTHLAQGGRLERFHEKFAVQLNDTHPAIAIPELMRLLVDDHHVPWDLAWTITQQTFAYTNHTLLPEALEVWSLDLLGQLLPRHLEIIMEINRRFLEDVRLKFPDNGEKMGQLSLIADQPFRSVRMAYLASVGSHAINGVAALHSQLLQKTVLRGFYDLWPEKFLNITNGVTPRRWMLLSNPRLAQLITRRIGDRWIIHLQDLRDLEPLAEDPEFRAAWRSVKQANKQALAQRILERTGIQVNVESLFDVQVKRIHEYKRQHLNVLHIITLYNRLKQNPSLDLVPRTFIFAGKAAPGYVQAKLIIRLITAVGEVINRDPAVGDRLKVVFLPDYNVTNGQPIYPAADLSEQISTAGKEASGTGNMKFALNGALTIGTLDGANIEIREAVGSENFFHFGHKVEELSQLRSQGYDPRRYCDHSPELNRAIHRLESGFFAQGNRDLFRPLVQSLLNDDPYFLMADYLSYLNCQEQVSQAFLNEATWIRRSILNTARMGEFSSDRSIREYAHQVWQVQSVPINLQPYSQSEAGLRVP
ncbi:glycogen/starch/alpha-glucan phosphorylase [Lyngbya confervoides]|uniref:Alpha-1,4 glucan phosphorylase n=1 Tax=Lyngbya confervoides BDU141951 TaxID=1574623 RepID=A0ABD4T7X6_9CYAN|nr:glycogen/starch/alpha-glucan phosphorylase [Lyngbya confervoides]MCM1984828.1 glycogen/starch/alpha-glucan phosphorylase [Lyngbya confervoides BDU141951]